MLWSGTKSSVVSPVSVFECDFELVLKQREMGAHLRWKKWWKDETTVLLGNSSPSVKTLWCPMLQRVAVSEATVGMLTNQSVHLVFLAKLDLIPCNHWWENGYLCVGWQNQSSCDDIPAYFGAYSDCTYWWSAFTSLLLWTTWPTACCLFLSLSCLCNSNLCNVL